MFGFPLASGRLRNGNMTAQASNQERLEQFTGGSPRRVRSELPLEEPQKEGPHTAGLDDLSGRSQRGLRRRRTPNPASPNPRIARVAGSGTVRPPKEGPRGLDPLHLLSGEAGIVMMQGLLHDTLMTPSSIQLVQRRCAAPGETTRASEHRRRASAQWRIV